ncbi:MAG: hypothetical protein ACERKD_15675 [Prolixibacteraceae bacterium]
MTIQLFHTKPIRISELENTFDAAILANISVTKPYFALKDLRSIDEYFCADFTTELMNIDEVGKISSAEVGRHMAILGSLVLSKENPKKEKHHYLATDAVITRCTTKTSNNNTFRCRAKLVSMNRKKGVISGEVFEQDGTLLYTIEVIYMVLGQAIFERMFADHRVETQFDPSFNPYTHDSPFIDLKLSMETCSASIGVVKKEDCPGHFNNFPALPVARMGTSMGKIGGLHFMHLNPNAKNKYFISNAELHARQLVFTGEEVKFRTEIVNLNAEKGMIIKVIAYNNQCDFIAESICNYHY